MLLFAVFVNKVINFPHATAKGGIEMVFDAVVSSAFKEGGYFGPFVAHLTVVPKQDVILLASPLAAVVQLRSQMVVPSTSKMDYLYRHCLPVF